MNFKYTRDEFTKPQYKDDEQIYYLKIDTKDRNTSIYPDPFNFCVKFGGKSTSKDQFNNTGLSIETNYDSIKYFEIVHLIVPRFLWTENTFLSTKLDGFNVYSPSIFKLDAQLALNGIQLTLNVDDIITVAGVEYQIQYQNELTATQSELLLKSFPPNITNQTLTLKKVTFSGSVEVTQQSPRTIFSQGINLAYFSSGDCITIANEKFIVNTVVSSTQLTVTSDIGFVETDLKITMCDKVTQFLASVKENDMCTLMTVFPKTLEFKYDAGTFTSTQGLNKVLVANSILLINKQIAIFDSIDGSQRLKMKNCLTKPVYNGPLEIVENQSTILIDGTSQTYVSNQNNNTLSSSFINFENYTTNTIFQFIDGGGLSKFVTLSTLISKSKITTTDFFIEAGFTTPLKLIIFPASYARTMDIANLAYLNVVVDELYKNDTVGTNDLLNKSFVITQSTFDGQLNRFLYLVPYGTKLFTRRDLQNVRKLTFKFYTPEGTQITMNNLLTTCPQTDERHVLHPTNQVFMTLKIVGVDHQFI
jgi:hypothetical protein